LRFARHYASLSFALRASFASLSFASRHFALRAVIRFAVILRFARHFALRAVISSESD